MEYFFLTMTIFFLIFRNLKFTKKENIMTKKLFLILSAAFILVTLPPASTYAAPCEAPATSGLTQVTPRADDIHYVYKKINGKTYKRLYNNTTNQWIGDWILVG